MENLAQKKDRSPPERVRILKANFRKTKTKTKEIKAMVFTRDMIIEELRNRGYVAQAADVEKNGLVLSAITVKKNEDDMVAPTVYVDRLNNKAQCLGWSLSELISDIEELVSADFSFDVEQIKSKEYFLTHARVGVQRETSEEILKRPSGFEGIEKYIYVIDRHEEDNLSIKVKESMLEEWGIDADLAFEVAEENSRKETDIQSMVDFLKGRFGASEDFMDAEDALAPIYIISNKSKFRGASAMLDKKGIAELADRIGVHEFILLPSSLHECILVPKTDDVSLETCENMVKEVNASVVDELDQLIDRAYLLTA